MAEVKWKKDNNPQASLGFEYYNAPTDFNRYAMIDKAVCQKIELKLYSTLGTSEMYKWLPEWGKKVGHLFVAGDQSIVLKTHKVSKYSIIKECKQLNSIFKESLEILFNAFQVQKAQEFLINDINAFKEQTSAQLANAQNVIHNYITQTNSINIHPQILFFGTIINSYTLVPIIPQSENYLLEFYAKIPMLITCS